MHDEDTCCVDGCSQPPHVRRSRRYPHLSGACKYHYHAGVYRPVGLPARRACLWCGTEFQPSNQGHRCCCASCSTSWSVYRRPKLRRAPARGGGSAGRVCVSCGEVFRRSGRGDRCGPCVERVRADEREARELRLLARQIRPVLVPGRPEVSVGPFVAASCPECLVSFVMTASHARMGAVDGVRYCSLACGKRADRRACRHRRRAGREGKRVYRARVFERDGWACRLCGDPLDRSADVPHPLAAVIDHIVPLALGGEHAHYNVQAAHFLCNSQKRDQLQGQVALPL